MKIVLSAEIIESHFILNRKIYYSFQSKSFEHNAIQTLFQKVKANSIFVESIVSSVIRNEILIYKKLRYSNPN